MSSKKISFSKELTPDNINSINEYETHNKTDSKDAWRIYLYDIFNGTLRKRLNEMISLRENKHFYKP